MKAQYANRPSYSTTRRIEGVVCRGRACAHTVIEIERKPSVREPGMIAVSRRCTRCGRSFLDYEPNEPDPVWRTVAAEVAE